MARQVHEAWRIFSEASRWVVTRITSQVTAADALDCSANAPPVKGLAALHSPGPPGYLQPVARILPDHRVGSLVTCDHRT